MKEAVEKALGFQLSVFKRLKGGSSPNFKAVRASDDFPFLVKLLPSTRMWAYPVLIAHLKEMRGTKAVAQVFADAPENVGDYKMVCLEWCEGTTKMPYQLSKEELREFLNFYLSFSLSLQQTSHLADEDPLLAWRRKILSCRGFASSIIRRIVEKEIPESEMERKAEKRRIIFGDFHHGNILFKDGCVHRVLDLESFAWGYPTDDFVRYFTCAYDHLKWKAIWHRRAMLAAFAKCVQYLPYTREEWMSAINAKLVERYLEIVEHPQNIFTAVNLLVRTRFYRDLKKVASSSLQ